MQPTHAQGPTNEVPADCEKDSGCFNVAADILLQTRKGRASPAPPRTTKILNVQFPPPTGLALLEAPDNVVSEHHVFHFEVKEEIGCPEEDSDGEEHLKFVYGSFPDGSEIATLFEKTDNCSDLGPGVYRCNGTAPNDTEVVRVKCNRIPDVILADVPHTILNVSITDSADDATLVEKLATYAHSMPDGHAMVLMQTSVLNQVQSVLSPKFQKRVHSDLFFAFPIVAAVMSEAWGVRNNLDAELPNPDVELPAHGHNRWRP